MQVAPLAPLPLPLLLRALLLPPLLLEAQLLHGRGSEGLTGAAAVAPHPCRCWEAGRGTAAAPGGKHEQESGPQYSNTREANRHRRGAKDPLSLAHASRTL